MSEAQKMKTTVKSIGLAMGLTAVWALAPIAMSPSMTLTSAAYAQEETSGMSLDQLLEAVKQDRVKNRRENEQREALFRKERSQQQSRLNKAKNDVKREEGISAQLERTEAENNETIATLEAQRLKALGEFNELIGVVKQVAGDTRGLVDQSLISSQLPDRAAPIGAIAEKKEIPSTDELRTLWATMLEEMVEQGKIVRYTAPVTAPSGQKGDTSVVRIGPFTAMTEDGFVNYKSDDAGKLTLKTLTKQPSKRFLSPARSFAKASGGLVEGVIDPSRGAILGTFVLTPSLPDRIKQGKEVGAVIIALGVISVILAILRIFSLWTTGGSVRRQIKNKKANKSNPLGRILLAYEANANADVETIELKLDEAILKEVPKLERGLNTLKVVAAVAPMLGLLGTVVGMILTFQSIQLYGAGDPKMMAGGISQALMTTVLGLVVAIPVLLLHSFASGMSKSVVQILEEQAAGIVARQAEGSR
jgi:biopolymer transport protein ExbB